VTFGFPVAAFLSRLESALSHARHSPQRAPMRPIITRGKREPLNARPLPRPRCIFHEENSRRVSDVGFVEIRATSVTELSASRFRGSLRGAEGPRSSLAAGKSIKNSVRGEKETQDGELATDYVIWIREGDSTSSGDVCRRMGGVAFVNFLRMLNNWRRD